jgi:hypothetical protein
MKLSKTQWAFVVDQKTGEHEVQVPKQGSYNHDELENIESALEHFLQFIKEAMEKIKQ